jgi:hypothetical protein
VKNNKGIKKREERKRKDLKNCTDILRAEDIQNCKTFPVVPNSKVY